MRAKNIGEMPPFVEDGCEEMAAGVAPALLREEGDMEDVGRVEGGSLLAGNCAPFWL